MSVEVPKGWREGRLKDLCEGVERRLGAGDKLEVLSVAKRGVVPQSHTYDKEIASEDVSRYRVIEPGEFGLAPMALYYGAIGRYRGTAPGIISPAYNVFRHSTNADPDFLEALIRTPRMIAKYDALSQGGNSEGKRKLTPYDAFETVQIAIPPLSEQRAIAEALRAFEAVINKTDAIIKQLGCTRTEIARLAYSGPSQGSKTLLKNIVGSIEAGVSVGGELRSLNDGEYGVLRTSSVSSGTFRPDQIKVIADRDLIRASVKPKADRIIMSRANTPDLVGASAYVGSNYEKVFLSDKLWQIDVADRSQICVRWLALVLSSPRIRQLMRLRANGTSGSMQNISKSALLSISIRVPPIAFQKRIGELSEKLETRVVLELRTLEQLRRTSDALGRELLSGRVRLPERIVARHHHEAEKAA
jgi:restriction endonuclease S subunit